MKQDKRMILAFVLSVAVLAVYHFLAPAPSPEPVADNVAVEQVVQAADPGAEVASVAAKAKIGLASAVTSQARIIEVRTPLYTAKISTAGGGITSFLLKEYNDVAGPKGKQLDLIGSDALQPHLLSLYEENSLALASSIIYRTDAPEVLEISEGNSANLKLSWDSADGVRIQREYIFHGGRYDFETRLLTTNGSKENIYVRPGLNVTQLFTGELAGDSYTFHGIATSESVGTKDKERYSLERYSLKDISKEKVKKGPVRWASADSKYFTWVVFPERHWSLTRALRLGESSILFSLADTAATLLPGESAQSNTQVFAGPKQSNLLASVGVGAGLENLIDYGIFWFMAKPLVYLMKASNRITGNYGIDIILLTILIKILFFPLSQKSMSSMRKMQELAPIMNNIKEKYKGDTNRINQETMNLYKTYKINPLSGCLPMIAQIPVFIALYKALLVTIELRHSPFFLWIQDLSAPEYLWNIDAFGFVLPIRLLPLLMGISMVLQQKLTPSASMDPMQQKLMLLMPVVFTFMFWGFPSGLVLYWLMNNVLSIGQQWLYTRKADAAKVSQETETTA